MTTPGDRSSESRRLAAIWFADIVGFTRLAAENETLALRLVQTLQAAATAAVERHEGTVVKFTGDGVLAEFASAEGAAVGGMQLLLRFGQLTKDWPEGPHEIRLGMHLGDITVAPDGDIYGDGVNRAARLEGLAEPGRLLVSEDVYRQLRARPDFILTDLGSRSVKGYDDPIRVYDAEPTPRLAKTLLREAATPEAAERATHGRRSARPIAVGLAVGVLSFITLALWTAMGTPSFDTARPPRGAARADSVPAAGPISTAASTPTADSRPNSTSPSTADSGPAATSTSTAESTPTVDSRDSRLSELMRRARDQLSQGTPASLTTATQLFTRSIELAPGYAPGHLGLADAQIALGRTGVRQLAEMIPLARGHLEDAIRHDAGLADAHAALASLLGTFLWDWESAEGQFETALELAPSPAIHRAYAELLSARGRHDEALAQAAMASSDEPHAVANVGALGLTLFRARSYARARVPLAEALQLDPTDERIRVHLARTEAILGERQQARITLEGSDPTNRSPYLQLWRALFRPATPGAAQARGNQLIRTLRRTLGPAESRNPDGPYNLAALQLTLGDKAGAAESLQRALRTPSPSLIWLATDPIWDPVRSDPDFQRLVQRIDAGERTR